MYWAIDLGHRYTRENRGAPVSPVIAFNSSNTESTTVASSLCTGPPKKQRINTLPSGARKLNFVPTKVQAALMADYDSQKQANFSPTRADDTRYGLKMLINF